MKTLTLLLAILALAPARVVPAHACDKNSPHISARAFDPPVRWAGRHDPRDARMILERSDGDVLLILTDDSVALQLSDQALKRVQRRLREEQKEDEDNPIAQSIKTVVLSSVRSMLRHSAECPVNDLRDVRYDDGRLILISEDGDHVFEDIDVNDLGVLDGYSEREARAFVREFRRVKSRS